jgi:hypothetical protein
VSEGVSGIPEIYVGIKKNGWTTILFQTLSGIRPFSAPNEPDSGFCSARSKPFPKGFPKGFFTSFPNLHHLAQNSKYFKSYGCFKSKIMFETLKCMLPSLNDTL